MERVGKSHGRGWTLVLRRRRCRARKLNMWNLCSIPSAFHVDEGGGHLW